MLSTPVALLRRVGGRLLLRRAGLSRTSWARSPNGKKFRSKLQMADYLGDSVDLSNFHFRMGMMRISSVTKKRQQKRYDCSRQAKSPLSEQTMNSEGEGVLLPTSPSWLPVSGLHLKRPASDENEPPKVDQKRAWGPPDPTMPGGPVTATPSFTTPSPAGPGLRSPRQAATALAAAGGGEKKWVPGDLGQLCDLRVELTYKKEAQELARENESLRQQNSALSMELQAFRAEATESLQRVEQLQETIKNQAQELETREAELHLAQGRLVQQNDALAARNAQLEQKLHQSEMERRLLHNTIQELKGNIRVFCRVRPLLSSEKEAQKQGMSHLRFPPDDSKRIVLSKVEESHIGRERKEDIVYEFNFDQVFPPSSSQEEVFEEISLLVQSALDGYHVCIFAYGQMGSGKTYTMEGPNCQDPSTAGMIPRAVQQIFKKAREMEANGWKYQFTVNCLEIYNDSLRDLLVLGPEQASKLQIQRVNQCTEELHVRNLCCIAVVSEKEVLELLQRAKAHRSVAKTNLNERSSRSHSLFQLRIEGHNANQELHTSSVLSLVDLAGSERLDKTLSTGDRLKETRAINSSLSNLAQVITALRNKEAHVPFRNSKLTHLLQNSLGGNSKILMFVNISPAEENFAESLNSLHFAKNVNGCFTRTTSNKK